MPRIGSITICAKMTLLFWTATDDPAIGTTEMKEPVVTLTIMGQNATPNTAVVAMDNSRLNKHAAHVGPTRRYNLSVAITQSWHIKRWLVNL